MAVAIPALALAYFANRNREVARAIDAQPAAHMDGRENKPRKTGQSTIGDPYYRASVQRVHPKGPKGPSIDQRNGVVFNRPVPLADQIARQNLVYELRRSVAFAGDGGTGKSALIGNKYTNSRALQMSRRPRTQPGLTVLPEAPERDEPIFYDEVGADMPPYQDPPMLAQRFKKHAKVFG